jgi:hypothetical protein
MMLGGTELQVLVATRPVDFRKRRTHSPRSCSRLSALIPTYVADQIMWRSRLNVCQDRPESDIPAT